MADTCPALVSLGDAYAPFKDKPEMFEDQIHPAPAAHELPADRCHAALNSPR